ncbi:MAG: phosphoribosylformylglycinamidine synthase subunit PurS [Gemmatimonadetes bacterium]|nr:phosphoribosylformylglycinamidine synthase subunit PurS [Gemmatimonadota bacterium]
MSQFQLEIRVKPRPGLLDPQGKAIHNALHSLGWDSIEDVRVGKVIYLELEADSREIAVDRVHAMCRKLLSNPVTEDFEVSVSEEVEAESL